MKLDIGIKDYHADFGYIDPNSMICISDTSRWSSFIFIKSILAKIIKSKKTLVMDLKNVSSDFETELLEVLQENPDNKINKYNLKNHLHVNKFNNCNDSSFVMDVIIAQYEKLKYDVLVIDSAMYNIEEEIIPQLKRAFSDKDIYIIFLSKELYRVNKSIEFKYFDVIFERNLSVAKTLSFVLNLKKHKNEKIEPYHSYGFEKKDNSKNFLKNSFLVKERLAYFNKNNFIKQLK